MATIRLTRPQCSHPVPMAGSLRKASSFVSLQIGVAYDHTKPIWNVKREAWELPATRMIRLKGVPDMSIKSMPDEHRGTTWVEDKNHDCEKDPWVLRGTELIEVRMTPEQFSELLANTGSQTDCTISRYASGGHHYREEVADPGTVADRLKTRLKHVHAEAQRHLMRLVESIDALKVSDKAKRELRGHVEKAVQNIIENASFAGTMAGEEVAKVADAAMHLIAERAQRESLTTLADVAGPLRLPTGLPVVDAAVGGIPPDDEDEAARPDRSGP